MKRYSTDDLCINFLNEPRNRERISHFVHKFYEVYETKQKDNGFLPVLIPNVTSDQYGNFNIDLAMLTAHQDSVSVENHLIFELNELAKHFLH